MDLPTTPADLDAGLAALLPLRYQHCLGRVRPDSMGSAGLRYDQAGRPAWDTVWTTFCDLALAGGPPHRGRWLPFPTSGDDAVAAEVARGLALTTLLPTGPADPGTVAVELPTPEAAAWLRAAVVAENVAAGRRGRTLLVPAGHGFRIEKEVKNVVVAVAKSVHYWDGHLSDAQQLAAAVLLDPAAPDPLADPTPLTASLAGSCDWATDADRGPGWVGVGCPADEAAVWFLRAVAVCGVLVRREGTVLCLPTGDPGRVRAAFANAHRLWLEVQG